MRSSDGSYSGNHGSHCGHGSHSISHTRMAEPSCSVAQPSMAEPSCSVAQPSMAESSHSVAQPSMAESSYSVTGDHTGFRHGYGHAHESDDL
jgi:hypothetical protein